MNTEAMFIMALRCPSWIESPLVSSQYRWCTLLDPVVSLMTLQCTLVDWVTSYNFLIPLVFFVGGSSYIADGSAMHPHGFHSPLMAPWFLWCFLLSPATSLITLRCFFMDSIASNGLLVPFIGCFGSYLRWSSSQQSSGNLLWFLSRRWITAACNWCCGSSQQSVVD